MPIGMSCILFVTTTTRIYSTCAHRMACRLISPLSCGCFSLFFPQIPSARLSLSIITTVAPVLGDLSASKQRAPFSHLCCLPGSVPYKKRDDQGREFEATHKDAQLKHREIRKDWGRSRHAWDPFFKMQMVLLTAVCSVCPPPCLVFLLWFLQTGVMAGAASAVSFI